MKSEEALIVFVKLPTPGNVKTRLAKQIGSDMAAALYRCFVSDTLAAAKTAGYPTSVYFHPPDAHDGLADWLGTDMRLLPQKGEDLGERMLQAFRETLPEFSRVVLVGSDSPDLPVTFLNEAFAVLKTHQVVIGPATDGGYYAIGFSAEGFDEAAFRDIEWGTPRVFETTMEILRRNGANIHVLPPWNDVDEYDDLVKLWQRHEHAPPGSLSTIDFLRDRFCW